MTIEDIEGTIQLMQKYKVRRFKTDDLELELAPQAFAGGPTTLEATPDAAVCRCGHPLETEHTEAGCLRGCPLEKCIEIVKAASTSVTLDVP